MTQKDFIYPGGHGLELGLDVMSSFCIQGAYPNNGDLALYLFDQQHQSISSGFWEPSLDSIDSADIISSESSAGTRSPGHHVQAEYPALQPPATAATPPCTPLPPPKRGRGRPRKNDIARRPKKKIKTFLPSPSTSEASSEEVLADNRCPQGRDTNDQDPCLTSLSSDSPESSRPANTTVTLKSRRDRNREAAQKCRTRKQHSTQKLVADVADAEGLNESLRREAIGLREEILLLKNMVLQHGDCDCAYIQAYIKAAACRMTIEGGRPAATLRSPGFRSTQELTP